MGSTASWVVPPFSKQCPMAILTNALVCVDMLNPHACISLSIQMQPLNPIQKKNTFFRFVSEQWKKGQTCVYELLRTCNLLDVNVLAMR